MKNNRTSPENRICCVAWLFIAPIISRTLWAEFLTLDLCLSELEILPRLQTASTMAVLESTNILRYVLEITVVLSLYLQWSWKCTKYLRKKNENIQKTDSIVKSIWIVRKVRSIKFCHHSISNDNQQTFGVNRLS